MAALPLGGIDTLVDGVTIAVVALALYYVVRQHLNRILDAKVELVVVYVAFLAGMLLEASRDFTADPRIVTAYTFGEIGLILTIVMLLTGVSYTYYLRPVGATFSQRVRSLFGGPRLPYGVLLLLAGAYFLFLEVYLVSSTPFTVVGVTLGGATVAAPRFDQGYIVLLYVVFAFYLAFPLRLFLLGSRRTKDPGVRRALVVLPLSWTAVGSVLLLFNGLLVDAGVDLLIMGHGVLAVTFGITAATFRDVDLLGSMFEPPEHVMPAAVPAFTGPLGVAPDAVSGSSILLEVEPSSPYERAVEAFVVERQSRNNLVYVFTSAASPLMKVVSRLPEVRFFILTDSVSYAEPTGEPHRTLVPQGRADVISDLIGKVASSGKGEESSVVFDNVSAMGLALGEQEALKMVRGALRALSGGATTSLFLVIPKAQTAESVMLLRGMFGLRLAYDSTGLHRSA